MNTFLNTKSLPFLLTLGLFLPACGDDADPVGGPDSATDSGSDSDGSGGTSGDSDSDGSGGGTSDGSGSGTTGDSGGTTGDSSDGTTGDSSGGTTGDSSGGTTGDSGGSTGGADDTTPPTVLSTSPADGDVGVADDAVIVITFSEPMAKADAQAAYQSSDIPGANATFQWNAAGDELTIDPNSLLDYAEGKDPNTLDAISYAFTVTTTATDLAGNPLDMEEMVSFSTKRRISTELVPVSNMTGTVATNDYLNNAGLVVAGDYTDNATARGFFSFNLSSLPDVVEVEEALLSSDQVNVQGMPHVELGCTQLAHVNFASFDLATFDTAVISELGNLGTMPQLGTKSADVYDAVANDIDNRVAHGNRSQYRVRCVFGTDNKGDNDWVGYQPDITTLAITYLTE